MTMRWDAAAAACLGLLGALLRGAAASAGSSAANGAEDEPRQPSEVEQLVQGAFSRQQREVGARVATRILGFTGVWRLGCFDVITWCITWLTQTAGACVMCRAMCPAAHPVPLHATASQARPASQAPSRRPSGCLRGPAWCCWRPRCWAWRRGRTTSSSWRCRDSLSRAYQVCCTAERASCVVCKGTCSNVCNEAARFRSVFLLAHPAIPGTFLLSPCTVQGNSSGWPAAAAWWLRLCWKPMRSCWLCCCLTLSRKQRHHQARHPVSHQFAYTACRGVCQRGLTAYKQSAGPHAPSASILCCVSLCHLAPFCPIPQAWLT